MPDAEPDPELQVQQTEYNALNWSALLACVVLLWLVAPIGVGMLLGTFLAFMAQPLFRWLALRVGDRGAATGTVVLTMLGFTSALGGLAWLFVSDGTVLAGQLIAAFKPGGPADEMVSSVAHLTERFGIARPELESHARDLAQEAASRASAIAEAIASTTGSSLLALFFAMLSMHYILRNWELISRRAPEVFPLRPVYTAALFAEFRQVGRTTLLGALGTAIAQGVFATIGYAIAGVPEPIFFGAATAVASFVPAVGVLLVIVPVAVGLFVSGYPGHGIIELVWSLTFVVAVCDYVIRPRLVRGEDKVPSLVTFAAIFGGVEVFGLKGLVIGPVMMALAIAVLRLYAAETRKRRHIPQPASTADEPAERAAQP
jgi:predicted PurR-regulated permease PerM